MGCQKCTICIPKVGVKILTIHLAVLKIRLGSSGCTEPSGRPTWSNWKELTDIPTPPLNKAHLCEVLAWNVELLFHASDPANHRYHELQVCFWMWQQQSQCGPQCSENIMVVYGLPLPHSTILSPRNCFHIPILELVKRIDWKKHFPCRNARKEHLRFLVASSG